jgi:YVTN family beta-propeller protein
MGVAYDPSNGYIYVTDFYSDTVSVINGANNTVIATIPVGSRPMGVAYDPSNGYIYVTNWNSGTVSVINGKTNIVIANITVGQGPTGIAYDPSNGYIYVANFASGTVSIISTSAQATETYTVTFTESGLPAGTQWSVTFNGLTKSSTTSSITFTGVPAGNYTWNVSSIIAVGNGTRYVAQISSGTISVSNASSVSISYVKQYRVTIQPTAGGSTSPSGTFWYNAGSTVNITAVPAPGYEFVGWETNSSITFTNSSSATTNAIINSPGTIVALFKAVPTSTTSTVTSSTTSSTQPSHTAEYVAAAAVVVIVVLAAVLLIIRRK